MFTKYGVAVTPTEYFKQLQKLRLKDKDWLVKIKEQLRITIDCLSKSNMYDTKLYKNIHILYNWLVNTIWQIDDAYNDARDTIYKRTYGRFKGYDDDP